MSFRTSTVALAALGMITHGAAACSEAPAPTEAVPMAEEPAIVAPRFDALGATKQLLITAVGLDYGEVQVGTVSPSQSVNVTNVSGAPLFVNMAGGGPGTGFSGAQNCAGITLAANASCQIVYTFEPTVAGEITTTANGSTNGQPFNIELRGTAVNPRFRIPSTSLDFGDVQIGGTQQQSITLTNIGRAGVVGAIAGGGAGAEFGGAQSCAGTNIAVNGTCQITYTFRPTVAGVITGATNGTMNGQPFNFTFTGNGVAPKFRISPTSLDFGQVRVGQTVSANVTLTNIGLGPVSGSPAGGAAGAFGGAQNCAGTTIAVGASCQFSYTFRPTAAGVVTYTTNGSMNGQPFELTFRGEGIGALGTRTERYRITQRALDFGEVQIGGELQQNVIFTNVSGAALIASISGGAAGPAFGGAQNCQGTNIPAGGSCQITYTFKPTADSLYTSTTSGAMNGQPFEISFRGRGIPPRFRVTPNALDFGRVQVGTSLQIPVTLTNVGQRAVTGSIAGGAAPSFGGSQNCQGAVIPVGGSCQVFYTFTPTAAGEVTSSTSGSMNGHPFSIQFKGTGVAPTFRITPYAFDFGEIPVGMTSAQQRVNITNIGTASVSGSIAGGAAGEFGGAQNCQSATLGVGQSCQVFYEFKPTVVGPIVRTTNGAFNGQPFAFRFSGVGLGDIEVMDLSPATISLANTATVSAVLLSTATFDATAVNVANVRMFVNGSIDVRPVSRGTAVVTSTRDWNGDGRPDRMFSFATSDLVAAGLTTAINPTTLFLRDHISATKWQARDGVPPTVVP